MCLAIFQLLIQNAGAASKPHRSIEKANVKREKYKEETKTNYRSVKGIL